MLAAGDTAPDFQLEDLHGRSMSLKELVRDGPALVVLFKTSCPVCQFTLPYVERLAKSTSLQLVGISQDDADSTEEFRTEFGITFDMLLDRPERGYPVSNDFGITTVPSLFLIGPDGDITASWSGWSKRDMRALADIAGIDAIGSDENVPEWKAG